MISCEYLMYSHVTLTPRNEEQTVADLSLFLLCTILALLKAVQLSASDMIE